MTPYQLPQDLSASQPHCEPAAGAPDWRQIWWLPCVLSLELPLARFTVRDLLRLRPGGIVETRYSRGAEIPLRANGQIIGWAEFEPAGERIGVRVTELI